MAKRKIATNRPVLPIRAISREEAERRRNPSPAPISKIPQVSVAKLPPEAGRPDWWSPARQHAMDVVYFRDFGKCALGHPDCKEPAHFRVIDPLYKRVMTSKEVPERFANCKVVTHTLIGPGTKRPGYVPMTVHTEMCLFMQPGIERTRLTRQTRGIGDLRNEEMIKTWQEEDRERLGRAVPAIKGRTVGTGSGRTLPTGQGSMFSSRSGPTGRRLDPVGIDEAAAQARPEYTVLARGVDSNFRPVVKVRIEGAPRLALSKPDPRHGPVVQIRPPDRPHKPVVPPVPGVMIAEANELIISVAHAEEYWAELGKNAKKDMRRKGLEPTPEDEVIRQTVRAWWKDVGTR